MAGGAARGAARRRRGVRSGAAVAVGALDLSGAISALGADGGGTLRIQGASAVGAARSDQDATWTLRDDLFSLGFARYEITGKRELEVAENAAVRRHADAALRRSGGQRAGQGRRCAWTPPRSQDDATVAELTQRKGAGLSLAAGVQASTWRRARDG